MSGQAGLNTATANTSSGESPEGPRGKGQSPKKGVELAAPSEQEPRWTREGIQDAFCPLKLLTSLQALALASQQEKMPCSTNRAPEHSQGCCEPPEPSLAAKGGPPKYQPLSLSWASQEHPEKDEY